MEACHQCVPRCTTFTVCEWTEPICLPRPHSFCWPTDSSSSSSCFLLLLLSLWWHWATLGLSDISSPSQNQNPPSTSSPRSGCSCLRIPLDYFMSILWQTQNHLARLTAGRNQEFLLLCVNILIKFLPLFNPKAWLLISLLLLTCCCLLNSDLNTSQKSDSTSSNMLVHLKPSVMSSPQFTAGTLAPGRPEMGQYTHR